MRISSISFLAAAFAALSLASTASAAPIVGQLSFGGYVEAIGSTSVSSATGLDFVQSGSASASPGVAGGITSFGAGTGSFAGLSCANIGGTCGTIQDITNLAAPGTINSFLTLTDGGTTISFDLDSLTVTSRTAGFLNFTADGLLHETGFDATNGTFTFSAQGNQIVSFSATVLATGSPAATPEPSSLALLATGLSSVAGFARRRRR